MFSEPLPDNVHTGKSVRAHMKVLAMELARGSARSNVQFGWLEPRCLCHAPAPVVTSRNPPFANDGKSALLSGNALDANPACRGRRTRGCAPANGKR